VTMIVVAWLVCGLLVVATDLAMAVASPAARMLGLIAATMIGMKIVVLAAARASGAWLPSGGRLAAFLVWFGMNPTVFCRRRGTDASRQRRLVANGLVSAAIGTALVALAPGAGADRLWLALPLLFVGLSMIVHFGLLAVLTALYRAGGVPVPLLFDAPWRARTPNEFWARRWNRGFTEMTTLAVHRPVEQRFGRRTALLASFVVSGLLHEVAISLPVRAGFGLPTCYFVLQGMAVVWHGNRRNRWFLFAVLALPLPLLVHPWFVDGVVVPFLE